MRINKTLLAAGVGLLTFAGIAISQQIVVPQVSTVGPNDLIQIIPNGQPVAGNVYAKANLVTSQFGYQKTSTGGPLTFTANSGYIIFNATGTIGAATIIMAANPSDGARECVFSSQTVTALVMVAGAGQTINDAATALTANVGRCYLYSASNLTWDGS